MRGPDDRMITEPFTRPEPVVTERSRAFWEGGAAGELRIARCRDCGTFSQPPPVLCPSCHGRDVEPEAVSGRGTVHSWTINRYEWQPGMKPPYVIAEIELEEQAGLRMMSNVVDIEIDEVEVGMSVEVCFVRSGEAHIPLFRRARS